MLSYVVRRVFFMIPVALLVAFATFMLIHLIPGDPAQVLLGESATPQLVKALDHQLGLDKPLPVQFGIWLWNAVHGNLGESILLQQPVLQAIWQRLPVSAELGGASLIFSLILALPLGVTAATHRNGVADWFVNVGSLLGIAIPGFVLGLALILIFAVLVRVFPPGGYVPFNEDPLGNLHDLILPMITLSAGTIAINLRQIRASMVEVLHQDYVRTAWAKGLQPSRVYYVHALRNALMPLLTIVGLQVGAILAGTVIVEYIFLWPGIGLLTVSSIQSKDFPVVQAVVLLSAFSFMVVNLLVDIGYGVLDPRIGYGNRR
jgi:ABC-type dipeptide/oligopeptide/nickel transport system permease component